MKITKVVTPSFFQANNGSVYSGVADGKVTVIEHRNRESMVIMTKANFDDLNNNTKTVEIGEC